MNSSNSYSTERVRRRPSVTVVTVLMVAAAAVGGMAAADRESIVPILECVYPVDPQIRDVWWGRFGYWNPNEEAVTIGVGEANFFLRPPASRGQPTVFQPGRHRGVVEAGFLSELNENPDVIRWNLDGNFARSCESHRYRHLP